MAGITSRGFEIPQRFDLGSYPKPRAKRTGPVATPHEELTAAGGQPFTRCWTWTIRQFGTGARTIRASPAMTGPAVIRSFNIVANTHEVIGLADTWAFGWSDSKPVEQFKGSNAIVPPGQVIFENEFFNDNATGGPAPPFGTEWPAILSSNPAHMDLHYLVTAPTFYLWIVYETISVNAFATAGAVTVINQVPLRELAAYMG